jgi:hypothetical protein
MNIQIINPEYYKTLIYFLKKQNAEYHRYQLREDKPTQVITSNLVLTTTIKLIKSEL